MLRCVKVLFSFAKSRSYLPKSENTEADMISKVKEAQTVTEIFKLWQMSLIKRHSRLTPFLRTLRHRPEFRGPPQCHVLKCHVSTAPQPTPEVSGGGGQFKKPRVQNAVAEQIQNLLCPGC
jgi:hypothetical protein